MSTKLLEKLKDLKEVTAQEGGIVQNIYARKGVRIRKYMWMCGIFNETGGYLVTSPVEGRLFQIKVKVGDTVNAGDVLFTMSPTHITPPPKPKAPPKLAPQLYNVAGAVVFPDSLAVKPQQQAEIAEIEELVMPPPVAYKLPKLSTPTLPEVDGKPTKNRTYSVLTRQEAGLKQAATVLKSNESETLQVAMQLFLALPPEDQERLLKEYREVVSALKKGLTTPPPPPPTARRKRKSG